MFVWTRLYAQDSIPIGAKALLRYYPQIDRFEKNHLVMQNGQKLIYEDGKSKNFEVKLSNPDIDDMMSISYRKGDHYRVTQINEDPGRVRHQGFFEAIYGQTSQEVEKNLVSITWCPIWTNQRIRMTRVNGVVDSIKKIMLEIQRHPELKKYVVNIGGAYLYRKIKGTNRQSTHSYGTAIDINVKYSRYWLWDKEAKSLNSKDRNQIPKLLIDIFERYGFIWGGKWYHYDTMHFEFRPELLYFDQ